jgi:hypothetical protein
VSKGFTGRHGRAYLVSASATAPGAPLPPSRAALANVVALRPVRRTLVTGAHTVADIECARCAAVLGWKYLAADDEAQRYKVGKFILEARRVVRWGWGEALGDGGDGVGSGADARDKLRRRHGEREELPHGLQAEHEDRVVFDSEDEDECEDLFLGVWSEALAKRRRREKAWRLAD